MNDKPRITAARPPRLFEVAKHYGVSSLDLIYMMEGHPRQPRTAATSLPLEVVHYIINRMNRR